jgi:hypothetical protein
MNNTFCRLWVAILLLIPLSGFSQSKIGNSPLSRYGLGLQFADGLSRNHGMGNVGIANIGQDHLNMQNPALLQYNRFVNIEGGYHLQHKYFKNEISSSNRSGGGPLHLIIGLPVSKKATVAFGIKPFSAKEYKFYAPVSAPFDTAVNISTFQKMQGSLSQVFLSSGFQVVKNFNLGVEASYLFGTFAQTDSIIIAYRGFFGNQYSITRETLFKGFMIRPGFSWLIPLNKEKITSLVVGGTVQLMPSLNAKNYATVFRPFGIDTINAGVNTSFQHPIQYGLGIAFQKSFNVRIAADFKYLVASGRNLPYASATVKNGWEAGLGGEYIPGTSKSTRYVNIINYRAGVQFAASPFTINNESIQSRLVTLGASFPIIRKESKFMRPLFNAAFQFGQMGNANTFEGRDRYIGFVLGVTLNDQLWFQRYRID